MLTLLCSPSREDNISFIYSQISAFSKRKALIIVPETHSHKAERRLLTQCGNPTGDRAAVITFSKLAARVMEEANHAWETIDAGGKILLMHKAVKASASALEYYKGAGERADILSGLLSAVSEFRSCLIKPEALLSEMGNMNAKLRDISVIYSAYSSLCGSEAVYGSDIMEMCLPHLEKSATVNGRDIYIYGFEGFTAAEYNVIRRILNTSHETTVAISLGEDSMLFTEQIKTVSKLEMLAKDENIPLKKTAPYKSSHKAAKCLKYVAESVFDFTKEPFEEDSKEIKLYSCKDPLEECDLVAGMCRRLVLEHGVRLRDIAVVTSDTEGYEKPLTESFSRYNLPLYINSKDGFLQKPAASAALGAFRALDDRFSMASVLRYIKSGLIGISDEDREILENYAYTWQIKGNMWFKQWTMSPDGYDGRPMPELMGKLNEIREKVVLPLTAVKESMPANAEGKIYAEAFVSHIQRIKLKEAIDARAVSLEASGREKEASEYFQIYDILINAAEQFKSVLGEDMMKREEFLPLFEMALSQYDIGAIPSSLDSVEFSDFSGAAFGNIDHVFVLGCCEGSFPKLVTGGGILKERDRITLETCGIELTQSDEERTFEYMSDIYQTIDSAVKSITFTRPLKSISGGEKSKSYLITRLEEAFPLSLETDGGSIAAKNALSSHIPAYELFCQGGQGDVSDAAYEFFSARPEGEQLKKLRAYSSSPRGPVGKASNISGLFGTEVYMSASRAEKLASCRFAFFMEYGLRAKVRKKAEFEAVNVGTLVHYVVENAVKAITINPDLDCRETADMYAARFLEERLGGREDKTARFMANYEALTENIEDIVRDILDEIENSSFKPIAYELNFDEKGDLPPYKVKSGNVSLSLHGQIDRVDAFPVGDILYLRVSDYKTGSKSFSLSDVLNGLNMQMFIYLLMLGNAPLEYFKERSQTVFGKDINGIEACAALYIPVKSPFVEAGVSSDEGAINDMRHARVKRMGLLLEDEYTIDAMEHTESGSYRFLPVGKSRKTGEFTATSSVATREELALLTQKTKDNLKRIASIIAEGGIEADPYAKGNGSYCDWCPYKPACQFDINMKKDSYRYLRSLKKDAVFQLLKKEEKENGR